MSPADLGFSDDPEIQETLAALLPGRIVRVSLSGTWQSRGSRFLTVYQGAEVEGWEELVDDDMEIAGTAMEERLEGSEDAAFLVGAYRVLLKSQPLGQAKTLMDHRARSQPTEPNIGA